MKALPVPPDAIGPSTDSKEQQEVVLSPTSNDSGINNVDIIKESGTADATFNISLVSDTFTCIVCEGKVL